MSSFFIPESKSLKSLFNGLYSIPDYQRPYSWGEKQLEELWDDLITFYEQNKDKDDKNKTNYFLGAIITSGKEGQFQDVIDGQQRLTTLLILFNVLATNFKDINEDKDNLEDTSIVKISTIENAIHDSEKRNRLKFKTHSSYQNKFEETVINCIDFNKYKKPKKSQLDKKQENRYINTALFFLKQLKERNKEYLGGLVNCIFNNVEVIKIRCTDTGSAIKLFQVLNTRGLELSHSDIIKSYLISNITDKDRIPQFVASWQQIETIVSGMDINLDTLMTIYMYYTLGDNPTKSMSEELTEKFKNRDSNEVVNELNTFTENYRDHIHNSKKKIIHSLSYLNWTTYWKTLVMAVKITNHPSGSEILKAARRYYYLNWIAGKNINTIKQTSFNILKEIKKNSPFSVINKVLEEALEKHNILALVKQNIEYDVYNSGWGKPLLLSLEYQMTEGDEANYIYKDNKLHTEHILPLEYKDVSGWEHITPEIEEEYLNSIGNLTLLSGSKNIKASNNAFNNKIEVYNGLGKYKDDDKAEGINKFELTKAVYDNYRNIGWNIDTMKKRYNIMIEMTEKLLDVNLEPIKKKEDEPETT